MRVFWVLTALLATTSIANAAPPLCGLSGSTAGPSTPPVPVSSTGPSAAGTQAPAAPVTAELQTLAFVQHVAASGASISDLGTSHGLRRLVARTADQFMIFQVAADGSAAVSGAPAEIAPSELDRIAGPGNITPLAASHGFKGFFVRSGPNFQVFYATPDNERLIPGVLWDATGKDVTRQQVAGIPGAVPTVEVTAGSMPQAVAKAVPLLEKAVFGAAGAASAPRIYMLIDPQCIYSIRAMQMLRPYIDAGRVQVAVVPLSVLDYEDKGESTRAALALLSKPADQIVSAWQSRDLGSAPVAEAMLRLRLNMQVADALKVTGTPTFVWRKPDGSEGRIDGVPESVPSLVASLGG